MKTAPKTSRLTLQADYPWHTDIDGEISEVRINGQKINDVHDLTQKVIGMTRTIKILAIIATALALMAFCAIMFLTTWLISNESSIEDLLLTSKLEFSQMQSQAESWNSHKRHRAYVTLNTVLGYKWSDKHQEWEAGEAGGSLAATPSIPQSQRRTN